MIGLFVAALVIEPVRRNMMKTPIVLLSSYAARKIDELSRLIK